MGKGYSKNSGIGIGRGMKIAVIGAGIGGMSAAYDFVKAGHQVVIFESADVVGGLASGFKEPHWDWSVERFYHHWFQSDRAILGLIKELGWENQVVFRCPKTVAFHKGSFYPLDSPLAALRFPGFQFPWGMIRFGLVTAYLRYLAQWQSLEKVHAHQWMKQWYGDRLYQTLFQPLLEGKFGSHYTEVNMAWMWARLKARTTRLGTFIGGFQNFADQLAQTLKSNGVEIRLNSPVTRISREGTSKMAVVSKGVEETFDQCLVTSSPAQFARMAPELPEQYLKGLLNLKSMGAVVMVLSLKHQLSREGYYWFNIPKSAGYPFLALVEHTNYLDPEFFGGDHIVYCGDYLDTDHEYFQLSQDELLNRFLQVFPKFNPQFQPDWVKKVWLWRTSYAQPVPYLNHSQNIPPIQTPLKGLFFASMSQVYPWDRGTNFAVEICRKAARLMLDSV